MKGLNALFLSLTLQPHHDGEGNLKNVPTQTPVSGYQRILSAIFYTEVVKGTTCFAFSESQQSKLARLFLVTHFFFWWCSVSYYDTISECFCSIRLTDVKFVSRKCGSSKWVFRCRLFTFIIKNQKNSLIYFVCNIVISFLSPWK